MGASSAKRTTLWPAGLLLAGSLAATLALQLAPPEGSGLVAAWFPPGVAPGEAVGRIAAADGRLVTAGGVAGLWIVFSEETGFAGRLYDAGAWLVLNAEGASGCLGNGRRLPRARPTTGEATS
ncbi:MAG TPA: hypothetical protein VD860_15675 [Azospirillum sp.]|nr:hypothetical protein [Azospirillum sp.]